MENIKALIPVLVDISLIFVVASIGLQSRWSDLVFMVRQPRQLLKGVTAVNIAVPLAAVLLICVFPMDRAIKLGIVLMAVSPLAPLVTGKMLKTGADRSYSVGLYVAVTLLSLLIVPLTLMLLSAIFPADAYIWPWDIAKMMFTSVFLPLCGGLLIGTAFPSFASRAAPRMAMIGGLILLGFIVLVVASSGDQLLELTGSGTLLVIVLTVVAAIAAGHWLGGPGLPGRMALALAAATRHPGLAILIAKTNSADQRTVSTVVLFVIVGVVVSGIYQAFVGRKMNVPDSGTA